MDQEQVKAIYDQYFIYILGAGILMGVVCGLVPLILAVRKKSPTLGFIALIVCGILGAVSPLLSVVAAIIFAVIIVRKKPASGEATPRID